MATVGLVVLLGVVAVAMLSGRSSEAPAPAATPALDPIGTVPPPTIAPPDLPDRGGLASDVAQLPAEVGINCNHSRVGLLPEEKKQIKDVMTSYFHSLADILVQMKY